MSSLDWKQFKPSYFELCIDFGWTLTNYLPLKVSGAIVWAGPFHSIQQGQREIYVNKYFDICFLQRPDDRTTQIKTTDG